MNKPIKLYIDTSVWNFALETDRMDSQLAHQFLQQFGTNSDYLFHVSDLVYGEVNEAYEARREQIIKLIQKFKAEMLEITESILTLAYNYVSENIIHQGSLGDAIHIATATVNRCEFLVSCNYKHIVRAKTIRGIHIVNHINSFGLIEIVSPREFMGK